MPRVSLSGSEPATAAGGRCHDRACPSSAELGADRAGYHVVDVTREAGVAAGFAAVRDRWGGIGVPVSDAGIGGVIAPVTEYPSDEFDRVLAERSWPASTGWPR